MKYEIKVTIPEIEAVLNAWKEETIAHYKNQLATRKSLTEELSKIIKDNYREIHEISNKTYNEKRTRVYDYWKNEATSEEKRIYGNDYTNFKWYAKNTVTRLESEIENKYRNQSPTYKAYAEIEDKVKTIDCIASTNEDIEKIVKKETENKRIKFYSRLEKVIGNLVDASNINIYKNRDINGFVVGTNGKAKVETIIAAGPINVAHFRMLIKKMK